MSATTLQGASYFGQLGIQLQAVGQVSITRYGLGEGDVRWKVPTIYAYKLSPSLGIAHPVFPWMTMEKLDFNLDMPYTEIVGHFVGAYPGGISTFDYQPSMGEYPITRFANGDTTFADLVTAAGSGFQQATFDPTSGAFLGFGIQSQADLAGVTSFLLSQGLYVRSYVDINPPDCSQDGLIASPDGNPPSQSGNGNWMQMPTVFQQRASIYDIRRSWKYSGLTPFPTIIYGG
jgi:hypothetical protein